MQSLAIRMIVVVSLLAAAPPVCVADDSAALLREARAAYLGGDRDRALSLAGKAIEANSSYQPGYLFRGMLHDSARSHREALADYDQAIELQPASAKAYNLRGAVHFKLGNIEPSISDFDRAIQIEPASEPHHWQRGISYYYAGRYREGVKQFELHQTVNPSDVENAVWHYLCKARVDGVEQARQAFIEIGPDRRVPMMQVYALYVGRGSIEQVFEAARAGEPPPQALRASLFYAHLYVGLYHEAQGNAAAAREHITRAAEQHQVDHYMWHVARMHAKKLAPER